MGRKNFGVGRPGAPGTIGGMAIAETPEPPYYAVIFTSLRNEQPDDGYEDTVDRMFELAADQPGFLGVESARHWPRDHGLLLDRRSLDRRVEGTREHALAQERGRTEWYGQYTLRIARVERDYTVETGLGGPSWAKPAADAPRAHRPSRRGPATVPHG